MKRVSSVTLWEIKVCLVLVVGCVLFCVYIFSLVEKERVI